MSFRYAASRLALLIACSIASLMMPSPATAAEDRAARGEKPNVVFILADDLGYTDLSCYGSKYYETPNLDRMATEGVRFTDGYTCGPNCQPTRAALHSGQYGPRTGVYTVGNINRFDWRQRPLRPVDNVIQLPLEKVTLADSMKRAGYATGMFGKWHLGNNGEHHPAERGFDEAIVSEGKHFGFTTKPPTEHEEDKYLADFVTDRAVDFIDRHQDEPFFLYLPHFGVHAPYQAKEDLKDKFEKKEPAGGHDDPTYAAMIASVDESVGRVLEKLDELGLAENTLVIFSSDNGGVGSYKSIGLNKNGITDNSPLKGGKGSLYEGGVRVPYVFRWKGKIEPGRTEKTPINSVDLYPTLLELAGGEKPTDYPLDGVSYAKLLTDAQPVERDGALYWHFPGYLGAAENTWRTTPVGAIRSGDWKLMEFFEDGRLELYNLKDDIGETKNLADAEPEKVRQLHDQLRKWREEIKAPMPTENTPVAAATDGDKPGKKAGKNKQGKNGKQNRRAKRAAGAG